MTPAERSEINTVIIAALVLVVPILAGWLVAEVKLRTRILQIQLDNLAKQADTTAAEVNHLSNGGGDAKIDTRLRSLGIIAALSHGTPQGRRKTDRAADYSPTAAETPQTGAQSAGEGSQD